MNPAATQRPRPRKHPRPLKHPRKLSRHTIHARALAAAALLGAAALALPGPAVAQVAPFEGGTATITNGPNWFKFVDPELVSEDKTGFAFEGISDDGTTIFGYGRFNGETTKFVWDHTQGSFAEHRVLLSPTPNTGNGALVADGQTFYATDFTPGGDFDLRRWTSGAGAVTLPKPTNALWARPFDATPDGRFVVGQTFFSGQGHQGFVLDTQTQQYTLIGDVANNNQATAVSDDGSVVVGQATNPDGIRAAYRWTTEGGVQFLSAPGADSIRDPRDVSADGQLVTARRAGEMGVWSQAGGFEPLPGVLVNPDLLHPGLTPDTSRFFEPLDFEKAAQFSPDNRWIAGWVEDDNPGGIWHEELGTVFFYDFFEMAGLDVLPTILAADPKWGDTSNGFRGIALNGDILTLTGRIGADSGFGGFVAQIDINTLPGIPEPGSLALLGLGAAALLLRRRQTNQHRTMNTHNPRGSVAERF